MNEETQPQSKTPAKRKSLIARFKNWRFQCLELAPPKEFEEWSLNFSISDNVEVLYLGKFLREINSNEKNDKKYVRTNFLKEIEKKALSGSIRCTSRESC